MSSIDAEALYRALLDQIRAAVRRPARRRQTRGSKASVLAGIHSGGAWLAERLAQDLNLPGFGVVNVALHRDDYAKKGLHSQASPTSLPFSVDDRRIVLVDDVLYTGRTIRAAFNELYDYGRPASVELAVLADRGGRELPVAARFIGGAVEVPADATLVLAREERRRASAGRASRFTRKHASTEQRGAGSAANASMRQAQGVRRPRAGYTKIAAKAPQTREAARTAGTHSRDKASSHPCVTRTGRHRNATRSQHQHRHRSR